MVTLLCVADGSKSGDILTQRSGSLPTTQVKRWDFLFFTDRHGTMAFHLIIRHMPDIPKMLVAADSIKQQYDGFLLRAKVADTELGRAAAHLCMTIAELFDATTCLIENGFSSHSPIMVRSMLEGMADLNILVEDATHLDHMAYESARSNTNIFERIAAYPENPEGWYSD